MDSFIIDMHSATQAYKARTVLARAGIRSAVERSHGRNGCSFRLRVWGGKGKVCALLTAARIPCDIP